MTDWTERANCKGIAAEVFFPESPPRGKSAEETYTDARQVCAGCVVRSECLDYALAAPEPFGMWGGKSPKERKAISKARRREYAENPKARLSRTMRATGRYTVAEIADELDVSDRTVERWTAGRAFPRVTPERGERPWCRHCDADRAATGDTVCRPCDEYRRKYGHLPDQGVLVKRWRARDERKHAS